MKKIIFILLGLFLIVTAYAEENKEQSCVASATERVYNDVTDAIKTTYGDTKQFAKDIYPDVKEAVTSIAKGIGVAAEHVYEVLIRQYVVEGVSYAFQFIIAFFFICLGYRKLNKHFASNHPFTIHVCLYLGYLLIGIIIGHHIPYKEMFTDLINPEWGAINYILNYTKTFIQ